MANSANHPAIHARLTRPRSLRRYSIPEGYVIALIMTVIFIQSSNLMHLLVGSGGPVNVVKQAISLSLIGIVVWYRRHLLRGALAVPELTALLVLAVLSYFWSVSPERWTSAIIPVVILSATAMTLGSMMSMRGLLYVIAAMLLGSAIGSLVAVAIFPEARSSGEDNWAQTWRGLYMHKNGLGGAMAVAVIMAIVLYPMVPVKARKYLVGSGLLALFLLVYGESVTAQGLTLILLGGLALRYLLRQSLALWAVVFLLSILALFVLVTVILSTDIAQPIFDAIGRKSTLSGRIPLWILSMEAVAERPWFGHGLFSFWDVESARVLQIARHPTMNYIPFYSHNGVVEILLNLGIVGLVLAVAMIARCIGAYFHILARTGEGDICVAYLLLVIAFTLSNATEAPILSRSAILWPIFVAIATRMCLTSRLLRQQHRQWRAGMRKGLSTGSAETAGAV